MAKPMTPDEMVDVLRGEGLTVHGYSGWRNRCRCCSGNHKPNGPYVRGWGSVNGVLTHITGGGLGGRSVEQYIRDIINGDPNVPVKAQFVTAPNGDVWLNSAGRANHAGKVGSGVRSAMINGSFSLTDDYDDRWRGAGIDGNAFTYGNENIAAEGKITDDQKEASKLICTAVARFYGWDGREMVGHGEVSSARYKVDPGMNMGAFRTSVMRRLGTDPEGEPSTPTYDPLDLDSYRVGMVGDHITVLEQRLIDRLLKAGVKPIFTRAGPTWTENSELLLDQYVEAFGLPDLLS